MSKHQPTLEYWHVISRLFYSRFLRSIQCFNCDWKATILRNPTRYKPTVVGGGSRGTANAAWLTRNGHVNRIWACSDSIVDDINLHIKTAGFFLMSISSWMRTKMSRFVSGMDRMGRPPICPTWAAPRCYCTIMAYGRSRKSLASANMI